MFTSTAVALPQKKRALRGRRLVVVDMENIVGGAVLRIDQAVSAQSAIRIAATLGGDEQVVVGTSHIGVLASGLGWRGSRVVARSGENGADLALLDVLTGENIQDRFDAIVLASGDGIFTEAVAMLGSFGVHVTVVANSNGCARRLTPAASETVMLERSIAGFGGAA